ncbi:MAG: DNA polymerase I [Chloroflexi bacterium]|nr:DNA polymerase I [Chloroflexota bacterium]
MADTLAIIDGNALVHRAFHALPDLTSPTGELVNAVYGFTMMLMKGIDDLKPTHLAAAFDTPRPTFRHQQYASYKATRAATPEGLGHQFGRVQEVLEVFGIPSYHLDGVEADDLLGTFAAQAVARGLDVVIITGDSDALQLVAPHVRVLAPRRGLTDAVLYDEAAVRERYGFEPAQLVDFKALRGDVSDNIPGVPGIGDKTAAKLIADFGGVAEILDQLDKVPARQQAQLRPFVDQLRMARELARIVCDVPLALDLDAAAARPPDRERAVALFHELGFRSLIDRLPSPERAARRATPQLGLFEAPLEATELAPSTVRIVRSLEQLTEIVAEFSASQEPIALVVPLDPPEGARADVVGFALSTRSSGSVYVPLAGAPEAGLAPLPRESALEIIRGLLENGDRPKVSIDTKRLMVALGEYEIELNGLDLDAGIAGYLLESGQRSPSLRDLTYSRLTRELPPLKTLLGAGRSALTLPKVPISEAAEHFGAEAAALTTLWPVLERELAEQGLEELYREVDLPLVPVLASMERTGIAVDVTCLKALSRELYERISALETGIYEAVGHEFNIGSPQQLASILFDELHLPGAKKTSTGRQSTAADVLGGLKGAHPCIDLILEHRELIKLKSTYIDALPLQVNPKTGRIHTTFHQTVAATGRLSSSDPNLQNIPIRSELGLRVRRAFIAGEPGWKLLSADYSQIELRVEAHMTGDPKLVEAFQAGEDIHAATAAELHGVPLDQVTREMRSLAKTANFAIIYGVSPFGFAEQTGLSQQDAAAFIKRYFERFPGVQGFQKWLIQEARETGTVTTVLGRRRTIPELKSPIYAVRSAGERMAINAPVQGTAADIMKIAMTRVYDYLRDHHLRSRMLLQVHDELLFEVPDDELDELKASVKEIMEGATELAVPLIVDLKVAENWGAMY